MDTLKVSDKDLDEKITETGASPLLVAFRKPVCKDCDNAKEWVVGLAQQGFEDQFRFAEMDVETSPVTTGKFNVLSVPNLILFQGSEDQRSGCIGPWDKKTVTRFLKSQLKAPVRLAPKSAEDYTVKAPVLPMQSETSAAVPTPTPGPPPSPSVGTGATDAPVQ